MKAQGTGQRAYPHLVIPNTDWTKLIDEPVIEPELEIVDAHHHLWDMPGWRYLGGELRDDLNCGHKFSATVCVECNAMYRDSGPSEIASVGETEFVNGVAAMGASGWFHGTRACAGIVGYADLRLGKRVEPILEAHMKAGGNRFRGIRLMTAWDEDPAIRSPFSLGQGALANPAVREGFSCLEPLGLSFDATCFHTQIADVVELARAFPNTRIILDHTGIPLRIERFATQLDEVFVHWKKAIMVAAECPNIYVKLGGLGMNAAGFYFHKRKTPPSSEDLAESWRPFIETAIEAFGVERSMFESNYPVDGTAGRYRLVWNAFKRIASGCSDDVKRRLFSGTATEAYRLDIGGPGNAAR